MALDSNCHTGVTLQPLRLLFQSEPPFRAQIGLVVIEKHAVSGCRREVLLRSWSEFRPADAPGSTGASAAGKAEPPGAGRLTDRRRRLTAATGRKQRQHPCEDHPSNIHTVLRFTSGFVFDWADGSDVGNGRIRASPAIGNHRLTWDQSPPSSAVR